MTEREFAWVEAHISDRPDALRLAVHGRSDGIDYEAAITQIECRRKFAAKLQQTLAAFPRFYFPSVLAGEQATSDLLACPGRRPHGRAGHRRVPPRHQGR